MDITLSIEIIYTYRIRAKVLIIHWLILFSLDFVPLDGSDIHWFSNRAQFVNIRAILKYIGEIPM